MNVAPRGGEESMKAPHIVGNAELHLHLEGSLSAESAIEIAAPRQHSWGSLTPARLRRSWRFRTFIEFLRAIREMCIVLSSYEAMERAAYELSASLKAEGIDYAEVYTSPMIFVRWGMEYGETLRAVDRGFARGEADGFAECRILLDSVRQFGVEMAQNVLAGFEANRVDRVVGFGLGGEESIPLSEFAGIYARARDLGLRGVVHCGETRYSDDIRDAVELLRVERLAHGIHAIENPSLLDEIVARGIAFDVSVTSNYRTRCFTSRPHPVRALLDAGARVTLSTDDPSLFRTTLSDEYRRATVFGRVTDDELRQIARNGIECSFADETTKSRLRATLDARLG